MDEYEELVTLVSYLWNMLNSYQVEKSTYRKSDMSIISYLGPAKHANFNSEGDLIGTIVYYLHNRVHYIHFNHRIH